MTLSIEESSSCFQRKKIPQETRRYINFSVTGEEFSESFLFIQYNIDTGLSAMLDNVYYDCHSARRYWINKIIRGGKQESTGS